MGTWLRRLLILAAPIIGRKIQERRRRGEAAGQPSTGTAWKPFSVRRMLTRKSPGSW